MTITYASPVSAVVGGGVSVADEGTCSRSWGDGLTYFLCLYGPERGEGGYSGGGGDGSEKGSWRKL